MKAYVVTEANRASLVGDFARRTPEPQEIEVEIHACGLNFADLLMLKGTYQDTPALPFIPGMEIAGVVSRCGAEVPESWLGQRVAPLNPTRLCG